ncbi:MAG: AAA family ATPase [Flavobacteriaceae bacterium]
MNKEPKLNENGKVVGQDKVLKELGNVFRVFKTSNCEIRPHSFLTGSSGTGKTLLIKTICDFLKLGFIELNGASLTKEGTSGNSLSKALSPLLQMEGKPTVVFVDEFDKLFISGNSNSDLAHESTNGVQNEFLKALESPTTSVFHDYGKYVQAPTSNCLFIFAGAFNGQQDITIDDLRDFGIKTEFIGRVGLCFNTAQLSLEHLYTILDRSPLLFDYCEIYDDVKREDVIKAIRQVLTANHEMNTLGARQINTLIHQYFIKGGKLEDKGVKVSFQKKLTLN